MPFDMVCRGCGLDQHDALARIAGGSKDCCPDGETTTADTRNYVRQLACDLAASEKARNALIGERDHAITERRNADVYSRRYQEQAEAAETEVQRLRTLADDEAAVWRAVSAMRSESDVYNQHDYKCARAALRAALGGAE